jgi:hypothetical protein
MARRVLFGGFVRTPDDVSARSRAPFFGVTGSSGHAPHTHLSGNSRQRREKANRDRHAMEQRAETKRLAATEELMKEGAMMSD